MTDYRDRHLLEGALRPELLDAFNQLNLTTMVGNDIGFQLTMEVFTVASLAAGCRHCQSHGAYSLAHAGVDTARIQALWSFESSDLFSEADRAALRFALAGGSTPNSVTPAHHHEMRAHYSDEQIADVLAVICIAGWLNRWNDSLATVTDQESVDWAEEHLSQVGWTPGKHTGTRSEQRLAHPLTMISQGRDPFDRD